MKFRPCIDLHEGVVKQIVGSTLAADGTAETNFQAKKPAAWFAERYRKDGLTGGHIIQLGPGNERAARSALEAWPDGMQIGGGVNGENAAGWIDAGASHVIVTSWVFHGGVVDVERLDTLVGSVGKDRVVLDLSCRRAEDGYYIVTDRWQTFTREKISMTLLERLSAYCAEFLIHAVDVEGKCRGIELPLLKILGDWSGIPMTYAGGIHNMQDIQDIKALGRGRIDFTVGSALDIFGGSALKYRDMTEHFGD